MPVFDPIRSLLLAASLLAVGHAPLYAQPSEPAKSAAAAPAAVRAPYEYDPYRVVIWVALEPSPRLPVALADDLAQRVAAAADQVFGAAWDVRGEDCPATLARGAGCDLSELSAAEVTAAVKQAGEALAHADKIFIVGVADDAGGYCAGVREFDVRSRQLGDAQVRPAAQLENVCGAAISGIARAFTPVVRLEQVEGNDVHARLRAGGLLDPSDPSPAAVSPGDLLQPVIRRNDRTGEPREVGGIQRLPYTFLEVTKRDGYKVECAIHSGVRGAIATGRSGRTERLALLIRPHERGTRLILHTRGENPQPLVGYEVLTRPMKEKTGAPAPLAMTDRTGAVHIPPTAEPIRIVYVRHGSQMLTRVPIVPGLLAEQSIALSDDDPRLLAESYFLAMQNNVMDLVARREVLAARIRIRLENKDVKGAQSMLNELRSLSSRADLLAQIDRQQAAFGADKKSEKMFVELRKLLAKHLDPKLVDDLTREVRAAG